MQTPFIGRSGDFVPLPGSDTAEWIDLGCSYRESRQADPPPDFAVLKPRDDYRRILPRPKDTVLAVEVASTTLDFDRIVKSALHARQSV